MAKFLNRLIYASLFLVCSSGYAHRDSCQNNSVFNIGAGIYDITGPAAEQGMMGYGMVAQQTAGMYQRLWARSFIIESPCNGKRIVFVNADLGQVFQGIKQQVVKKLKAQFGNQYDDKNILITATHTHSGPGGYSTYAFYNLTTFGFSRGNFDAIIDGIVASIARAHQNMRPGQIKIAKGKVNGISFNRSPDSYLLNPLDERKKYTKNIDNEMTLIRLDSLSGEPIGMINWFPLHGVSVNNKNHLINGDNKGYAEYRFEQDFGSDYSANAFVAAFAQAHAGDVSPNQLGYEGGSGEAGLHAVELAGNAQYETAKKLYTSATKLVTGGIDFNHTYVTMDEVIVDPIYTNGAYQTTCPAAIGVSMLAGTQDGEGIGRQGVTCETISKIIPHFICELRTTECQGVKPIALSTGLMKPYSWTPNILPFQMFKVGNLVIGAAPFELTTMSGRRIEAVIKKEFKNSKVVLSALANAYAGYVATPQEYQLQRYEGASTHFGPWTLSAIQQTFARLSVALNRNEVIQDGPQPLDLADHQINLQPGVVYDSAPLTKHFGDVHQNTKKSYQAGEKVEVIFWGAHPKNNYHNQATFLKVERFENGSWKTIRTDNDWDTEYRWSRNGLSSSLISIIWRTSVGAPPGLYRVVHFGDAKAFLTGTITPYTGYSGVFQIN